MQEEDTENSAASVLVNVDSPAVRESDQDNHVKAVKIQLLFFKIYFYILTRVSSCSSKLVNLGSFVQSYGLLQWGFLGGVGDCANFMHN